MKIDVCLIFDIGKTNKKAFLFDENYQIIWETSTQFEDIADDDGEPCEDLSLLKNWVLNTYNLLLSDVVYNIKAVNFSAYGASFVHIDRLGNPVCPLYNYTKPFPEDLHYQFYKNYGPEKDLSRQTASPILGNLNSGLQIYLLKYKKTHIYKEIAHSLHLPQYVSFLISGNPVSEITSVGCHTHLWDFERSAYHAWVEAEKLNRLFPPFPINLGGDKKEIFVGNGLHDSSSALIPYLKYFKEPFLLLSTGTWAISLNPFNNTALSFEELEQDCLAYLSFEGKPVKASRLFAGAMHEETIKSLSDKWNKPLDYFKNIKFDTSLSQLNDSYEKDYFEFMKSLFQKQVTSTDLVYQKGQTKSIFVDGGFSKNDIFMNLLAKNYPEVTVYAAEVAQASAIGAAIAIHEHWNQNTFPTDLIKLKKYAI